jgi:hypothetical protein
MQTVSLEESHQCSNQDNEVMEGMKIYPSKPH